MKRILAVLLCALMLAGILPLGVLAEEAVPEETAELSETIVEPEEPEEEAAPAEEPEEEAAPIEEPEEEAAPAEEPEEEAAPAEEPEEEAAPAEEPKEEAAPAEEPKEEVIPEAEPEVKTEEPKEEIKEESEPEPEEEEIVITVKPLKDAAVENGAAKLVCEASVNAKGVKLSYEWQQLDASVAYETALARDEAWETIPEEEKSALSFAGIDEESFADYASMLYRCIVRTEDDCEISTEAKLLPDPAWTAEEPEEEPDAEEEVFEAELIAAPAETEAALEVTETAEGETQPEETEAVEGEPIPEETEAVEGETQPEETETVEGETQPEETETVEGETQPEETEAVEGEAQPEETEAVEGEAIPEETLEEGEMTLMVDVPKISGAAISFDKTSYEMHESATLQITGLTYVDSSVVAAGKTKFAWYKIPKGGTAQSIGNTAGETNAKFVVMPVLTDKDAEYYCVITAYNTADQASESYTTAKVKPNVTATCTTSNGNIANAADLKAVFDGAGGAAITVNVDNELTLMSDVTIPANATVNVLNGGKLIVSANGAVLTNKGKLEVKAGGTFSCTAGKDAYTGTRIIAENSTATIEPTDLPYGDMSVSLQTITDVKVGMPSASDSSKYIAGISIPAELSYKYTPYNAGDLSVTISSDKDGTLTPDADGKVTFTTAGTHTVTVASKADPSVKGTCTVTVGNYELEVSDSNDSAHQHMVFAETTLKITAKINPGNVNGTKIIEPTLTAQEKEYATLSMTRDTANDAIYYINLYAKKVTGMHTVKVHIETEDGKLSTDWSVDIYPTPGNIAAMWETSPEENVSNTELYYNIDDNTFPGFTIRADVIPTDAYQPVTWSYTDSNQSANVSYSNNGGAGAKAIVKPSGLNREGIVTLTAKSYSGITTSVTIHMIHVDTSIKINVPSAGYLSVRAGAKLTITATAPGTSQGAKIKWSMDPAEADYGKIDEKTGVFTATQKASAQGDVEEVDIYATLVMNGHDIITVTEPLKVVPEAQKAVIKMNSETFTTGQTIRLNASKGNSWTLIGVITPGNFSDSDIQNIKGYWSSSDPTVLTITADTNDSNKAYLAVVPKDGSIATGTSTITFTANDGTGVKTNIKVNVSHQIQSITLWADESHKTNQTTVLSGSSLQTYAVVTPADADNLKLTYQVINCDDTFTPDSSDKGEYATVSTSGKVSVKTIYSDHYVIIRAKSNDGGNKYGDLKLKLEPRDYNHLLILNNDDKDRDVTGMTLKLDVLSKNTLDLGVKSSESVTFSSSKTSILSVDSTGLVKYVGSSLKKPTTVTITATDKNTPARKATVKITVTRLVQKNSLTVKSKNGKNYVNAGQKLTLLAKVSCNALNKKVTWSLDNADKAYGSISAKGVFTAKKNVVNKEEVTVICKAADGSGVSQTFKITIYPKASYILLEDSSSDTVNGKYFKVNYDDPDEPLTAKVYSADASQAVTWKTSNKKVATVTSNGLVKFTGKTGKAVISATAKDGSKKTAKVTYQVVAFVDDYDLNLTKLNTKGGNLAVRGGSSVALKVKFIDPKTPTNKKINWKIKSAADQAYASVTSAGRLTAVDVTEEHQITVTAVPADDPDNNNNSTKDFKVWILPRVKSITLKNGSVNVTGTTVTVKKSVGTVSLTAEIFPAQASANVVWKSSNTKVATVNSAGVVTLKKAGKARITATAQDGTKKAASVTLSIYN